MSPRQDRRNQIKVLEEKIAVLEGSIELRDSLLENKSRMLELVSKTNDDLISDNSTLRDQLRDMRADAVAGLGPDETVEVIMATRREIARQIREGADLYEGAPYGMRIMRVIAAWVDPDSPVNGLPER